MEELRAFSPADAERVAQATRQVLAAPARGPDLRGARGVLKPPLGVHFVNESGQEIPPHAVLAVKDYKLIDGGDYFFAKVEQAGTTLRDLYLVNGIERVAVGATGFCETQAAYFFGYDPDWTPASGQSGGPKPGSWWLHHGYPAIARVYGVQSSDDKVLRGTLAPVASVWGKPESDIAPATSVTQPSTGAVVVQYFDGTQFQPTTFNLTGTNVLPYKLKANRLYKWVPVGDQWCPVEQASRTWAGTIAGSVGAGGTASVVLSDGTSHSGCVNVSGQELEAGAVLVTDDAYNGSLLITGAAPGGRKFWKCSFNEDIDAGDSGSITLSDTSIGTSGAVTATNWSYTHHAFTGRKGFAWKDIDDSYYFIPDGLRWFLAELSADLDASDLSASITHQVSLDGGSTPSVTAVDNQFGLSGRGLIVDPATPGDTVLVVESPNAGSEKHVLVQITGRANKPRWFKGALSAALESSDAGASIDTIAALDGGTAPTSVTAKNPHSLAGLDNGDVLFCEDWDDLDESDNPTYILVQVKHVAQSIITAHRYDSTSHKWQYKSRTLVGMWDDAESDWTDELALTLANPITAVDWSSPDLKKKTTPIYVAEKGTESGYTTILSFEQITVATSVEFSDPSETYHYRTAYVVGPGTTSSATVWTGTTC